MTVRPPYGTDVLCEDVPGLRQFLSREFPTCVVVSFAFGVIFHAALNPYPGPSPAEWLRSLLFNTMIAVSIGTTLSIAYYSLFPAMVRRGIAGWLAHVLLTPVAVAAGAEVAVRSIEGLGGPEASLIRPNALRIGLAFGAIGVAGYFLYDRLRSRVRRVELRAEQAQREALRTQLKSLHARTNPHVLFNSLNTVAGLIEEDPRKAERVLVHLSSLYRYCLKGSAAEWVRLEEELAATKDYLQVEEVRLGSRLQSSLEVERGAEAVLVPPLILQPLVENAIHHGIAHRREGGRVAVRISRSASDLLITVIDDGPGPGNSCHQGSGTALADLGQRLRLIYGDRASLDAGGVEEGGFRIEIRLPVELPS